MQIMLKLLAAGLAMVILAGCASSRLTPPQVFSEQWSTQKQRDSSPKRKPVVLVGEENNPAVMVFEDESGRTRMGLGGEKISAGVGNKQVDIRYQIPLGETPKRLPGAAPTPE